MLLEKLEKKDKLTDTEAAVADYIIEHKDEMINITIGRLAEKSYSSNASVIRICRKLGFKGFKDFKIALLLEVESQKYTPCSFDYSFPFTLNESSDSVVRNLGSLYKESIDIINSRLDCKVLDQVVKVIMKSNRFFIFAVGDSGITAMNFINKMVKIDYFPILATDNHEEASICKNMSRNDCALFISYRANYDYHHKCIEILNSKSVPVISLSAIEKSPLIKRSNLAIIIPEREHGQDEKIATFYSQLAFQYVLSIIYSLIYKNKFHQN